MSQQVVNMKLDLKDFFMPIIRLVFVGLIFMVSGSKLWAADCLDVFPSATNPSSSHALTPLVDNGDLKDESESNNVTLDLAAGQNHDYDAIKLGNNFTLTVSGSGTARWHFNGTLELGNNAKINEFGDPEDLVIYLNGNVIIGNNAVINALIYANGNITIGGGSTTVTGALSANGNISVGGSGVTYDASAVNNADFAGMCTGGGAPTSLVAEYRFEESSWNGTSGEVKDSGTNSLNGTALNGATTEDETPDSAIDTDPGTCRYAQLDSNSTINNKAVEVSDNNALDLSTGFTLTAWIRHDRPSPNIDSDVVLTKGLGATPNYRLTVTTGNKLELDWGAGTLTSSANIANTTWTHVAATFDNGSQALYINGSLDVSDNQNDSLTTNSGSLFIGKSSGGAHTDFRFSGQIDEVRIYDGALGQTDIQTIYNETHACPSVVPDSERLILATSDSETLGGLSFDDEDAVSYNASTNTSTLYFDGGNFSDNESLDAFSVLSNGNYILSTEGSATLGGLSFDDDDLVEYNPNTNTATLYRNMRAEAGTNIDVDAAHVLDNGDIVFSTTENFSSYRDEDLVLYDVSNDSLSMYLDVSTIGSSNDLKGVYIRGNGNVLLSFSDDTTIQSVSVLDGDVVEYNPSNGTASIYFSESNFSGGADIRAVHLVEVDSSCTLGSFVISQPAYGLACPSTRSTISITAMCDDGSTVKDDYAGTINLSTNENSESDFYAASTGGTAITSITLDGSENGTTNVYLFHKNENADLKVTASDSSASVSSEAATGTDYRTAGFRVSQEPTNFVCGGSTSLTLQAYGQTENSGGEACEVITGFTGNKNLKVWFDVAIDPDNQNTEDDSVSSPIVIGGTSLSTHSKPASNNFAASFSQGEIDLSIAYLDAGRILDVNFTHDEAPYDGSVSGISELAGASTAFVVSPEKMLVSVADANAACATANLANCTVFKKTGENFDLNVSAVCSDVSETVASSYQGDVALSHSLVAPGGGNLGSILASSVAMTSGNQNVTQNVDEVGVFTFTATPEIYFGVDANTDSVSDITAATSANVGRFIPDDFNVTVSDHGSLDPFCDVDSAFSYIGQAVSYEALDLPIIAVTAQNHLGGTTQNYTGDFIKLAVIGIDRAIPSNDTGNGLAVGNNTAVLTRISEASGVLNYRFGATDSFTYTKNAASEVSPFTSDLRIAITGVNDGEVSSSTVTAGSPVWVSPTGVELRYGRWNMENVFGSELESLMMLARAEFLNNTGNYALNSDDSCTAISQLGASDINLSSTPNGTHGAGAVTDITVVGAATTDLSYNSTLDEGSGNFVFTSPGFENTGRVDLDADLSNVPWLQHDWDSDGTYETVEEASATFGQYRGNDRIIYWREVSP